MKSPHPRRGVEALRKRYAKLVAYDDHGETRVQATSEPVVVYEFATQFRRPNYKFSLRVPSEKQWNTIELTPTTSTLTGPAFRASDADGRNAALGRLVGVSFGVGTLVGGLLLPHLFSALSLAARRVAVVKQHQADTDAQPFIWQVELDVRYALIESACCVIPQLANVRATFNVTGVR